LISLGVKIIKLPVLSFSTVSEIITTKSSCRYHQFWLSPPTCGYAAVVARNIAGITFWAIHPLRPAPHEALASINTQPTSSINPMSI